MKITIALCIAILLLGFTNPSGAQSPGMYHEPFRPQFHYSPPEYWMNDPNGLVYYDGEYHLFYQYHPGGLTWGPMHWGHAVSPDLIHWETLPIALYPDEHGTIFSGSAVIDVNDTAGFGKNAMVAIYSYDKQTQGVAYSTDRGRTWTKYAGNPVLPALAKDFRDPKVFWYAPNNEWVMVIAAGHEAQFFTSPNLRDWTLVSRFAGGQTLGVWEVPDIFPLQVDGQTKWVLLISVTTLAPAGGSGIQYFIGDFDGHTFTNENAGPTLWMDYGADNYAGTTWSNEPNNDIIYIGWLNNWQYAADIPTSVWRGATTMPRKLSLVNTADGLRLVQTPVASFAKLRGTLLGSWDDLTVDGDMPLSNVHGRLLEIVAEIDTGDAARFGIDVHRGADAQAAKTRLIYNRSQDKLLISRTATTSLGDIANFSPAFGAPLTLENNQVRLHLLVDESSLEGFVNDGTLTMTAQTFVDRPNDGVALFADGGSVTFKHLEIYALNSIWPE